MSRTTFPFLELSTLIVVLFACLIVFVPGTDTKLISWLDQFRSPGKEVSEANWPNKNIAPASPTIRPPNRLASRLKTPIHANVGDVVADFVPEPSVAPLFTSDLDTELESNEFDIQLNDQSETLINDDEMNEWATEPPRDQEMFLGDVSSEKQELDAEAIEPQDAPTNAWTAELTTDLKPRTSTDVDHDRFDAIPLENLSSSPIRKQTIPNEGIIQHPGKISNPFAFSQEPIDSSDQIRTSRGNVTVVRNKFVDSLPAIQKQESKPTPKKSRKLSDRSEWEIEQLPAFIAEPAPVRRSPMTSLDLLSPDNRFRPRR